MEFVNADGAQCCNVCNSTFKVFDLEGNSLNFCPFCSAPSEKIEPVKDETD